MDSDIDIEEHNLLENPALHALFPDITVIKQEVFDYADTVPNTHLTTTENMDVDTLTEFSNTVSSSLKKTDRVYRTSFSRIKYDEIETVRKKREKNMLENKSFKRHLNHKLKNAVIVLSDVSYLLQRSNQFCKICSILFFSEKKYMQHRKIIHCNTNICNICNKTFYQKSNLDRHMKNIHSRKVKEMQMINSVKNIDLRERRSNLGGNDKQIEMVSCFHCTEKFISKQLLIEHLYAVLEPKFNKKINSQENKKPQDHKNIQTKEVPLLYKCSICYHYFKQEIFYYTHMTKIHRLRKFSKIKVAFNSKCDLCGVQFSNFRLYNKHMHNHKLLALKKLRNDKKTFKHRNEKYRVQTLNYVRSKLLIPKDTIFKCCECDGNFLSPSAALDHKQHIQAFINWKCKVCNLIFNNIDSYFHMKQHCYKETFTIVKMDDTTYSKLLYSCSTCRIHFEEKKFIQHYKSCKELTPQYEYCTVCDVLIDSEGMELHKIKHNQGNRIITDFIYIDSIVIRKQSKCKGKFDGNMSSRALSLNYCNACNCFVPIVHKIHLRSQCNHLIKFTCKFCGFLMTNKGIMAHRNIHYKNRTLKLQDFTFYDLHSGKQICPQMPSFQKCLGCNIHLWNKDAIRRHLCGIGNEVICEICDMKFSEEVYKVHLPFHYYILKDNNSKKITDFKSSDFADNLDIDKYDKQLNQYDYKNNEIELFSCKLCSSYVETYDGVVEHCQQHLLCLDNKTGKSIDISKNTLQKKKVFYFDPFYYGSNNEAWLKHIFDGLSQDDIKKKLTRSLYKDESRIKLKLKQEGNPLFTEYKCETCNCCVDYLALLKHINNCVTNPRKHLCQVCKLPFLSKMILCKHTQKHKVYPNSSCQIVSFNFRTDKKINDLIKSNLPKLYVIYKCRNCDGVVTKTEFSVHVCNVKDLQKCNYCGLLLYRNDLKYHIVKHKQLDTFTANNMKVILLGNKVLSTNSTPNPILNSFMGIVCDYSFYKCIKCDVCIKDVRCTSKHYCLVDAAKGKCKYCNLIFDEGKLKNHIKLHLDDEDFVEDNILTISFNPNENKMKETHINDRSVVTLKGDKEKSVEVNIVAEEVSATLYRCVKCDLHFMEKWAVNDHIKKAPVRVVKQICTKCGISFSPSTLYKHLLDHHGKKDLKYKFSVEDVYGNFKKYTIYVCVKCNLHFIKLDKAKEHFNKCLGDSNDGEKCKCCNITFHTSCSMDHEKFSKNNTHFSYNVIKIAK